MNNNYDELAELLPKCGNREKLCFFAVLAALSTKENTARAMKLFAGATREELHAAAELQERAIVKAERDAPENVDVGCKALQILRIMEEKASR